MSHSTNKISHPYLRLRHLWLSLLMLLVGTNSTLAQVAKIGEKPYATLQEAFDAATDGQTVTLQEDYDATGEYPFTAPNGNKARNLGILNSITFDGANHVLTVKGNGIWVGGGSSIADVTIKDVIIKNSSKSGRCIDTRGNIGSLTLDGVTLSTDGAPSGYTQPLTIGGNQANAATVNITNSTIQTNEAGTAYYAIITFNPVNMTISNSTLKGWACIYAKGENSSAGSAGSTFTIDHSNIVSSNAYSGVSNSFAAFVMEDNNVTINITNSDLKIANTGDQYQTIAGSSSGLTNDKVKLGEGNTITFVEPGQYALKYGSVEVDIEGGTYNVQLPDEILPEGYICVDNGDGTFTVKQGTWVAQIGDVKYETLAKAVAAAEEGATIDILKDFTLTTVTTSPSAKYNVNVDKSVTINGNNHVITGSEGKRPIILMGDSKNITLKDLTLKSNKAEACLWIGDAVNVTLDNTTLDGTKGKSYNQPLTIGQFDSENRATVNITNGSVIKTNDTGTAHYSIIAWHPSDITVTDSKLIGWANVYLKPGAIGSTVKIDGSEMKSQGLSGSSNNFAVIVTEGNGNTIEVKDTKIEGAAVEGTYQSLFMLRGQDNVLKFLGSTTYETNDMTWGKATYELGSAEINKIYFDETTKAAFAKYFAEEGGARISETTDETGLYPLNYVSEVYYYWLVNGVEEGGNYDLAQPFVDGWLDNGEFIRLKKDVALTSNLTWAKENASFTMTFGDYKVTKGEYSIALKQGVTVNTDQQTDIFTAVDADFKVVETAVEGGYTYTVVAKEYVAKIGDVKYETLQDALDAAEADDIEDIVIDLLGNASLDITARNNVLWIGTENTKSITINGNDKTLTFNQKNSDWNDVSTKNDAVTKLVLNDMHLTSSGYNNGPWNRHDIHFSCAVELNNVTSDKALAFKNDATLKNVTVTETGDVYAIWVQPNRQNISIDGLTVNASNGRGIKIDDQYVDNPEQVTLSIDNATFNTKSKSAILVKSAANTVITAGEGIIIANVAADKNNLVWVDEDRAEEFYKVTVNNATIMPESKETDYVACLMNGEQRWGFYKGTSALSKAIDKVEDGYSIKLFQTTAEAVEVSKPLVITKNGYTADNVTAADGFVREESETEIVIREFNPVCAIDDVKYETLESAFAAAKDGETIKLLADCAGNGIKVPQGKYTTGLTVDFDGHTYTMDGEMVGSTGTETQAFQLLKDNKITFKGGTITSEKAYMLVQNYSDLTLEGMTLTLTNTNYDDAYTLSNNNGNIVIDGSIINANPAGSTAFDVCRYSSYASVSVTVKGASVINGDVEVDAGGGDPKDGLGLTVEGGTFNGNLRLTNGGATAITDTPDKAVITKSNDVTIAAPTDFKWKDNGDGTSTLVPCVYVAQIGDVKYESLADAVAAVPTDGTETTITMIANHAVEAGVTIAAGKNIILELNGKVVSYNSPAGNTQALITNRGTLVIQDNTDTSLNGTGTGLIGADYTNPDTGEIPGYASNTITNGGTLTVKSGKIINSASSGAACYVIDNNSTTNNAILNIEGGYVYRSRSQAVRMFCNSTTYQNTLNISGGIVEGGYAGFWTQLPGSSNTSKKLATINITGGEVKGGEYSWYDYSFGDSFEAVNYNVSGGKLTGYIYSYASAQGAIDGFISGGYFSPAPSSSYIKPAGYMFVPSEEVEGYYVLGLAEVDYSWTENGTEYHDYLPFNTPFKNNYLMDGETITLLQNITLTEDLTWNTEGDATFTLNLGEFKITKGNFSIKLVPGQRVNTDKTTSISIFTSAEEGYVVKSAKDENGKYYYTVEEAEVLYTAANGTVKYMLYSSTMVSSDGTYKLLKDVSTTARLAPGIAASNVTLDLNGHTLTSTATDCAILLSRAGSSAKPKTFNLIDTSDDKGGMLKVNPDVNIGIQVSGKYNQVTIGEGVTVDGDCVALLGENQTLTVNGTINGGNDFAVATNGSSTKNTNITINEGAVLTSNVAAMYLPGNEGLTATVNGGTITGGTSGIEIRAGQLVVNGGNITSTATEYSYTPNGSGSTTKGAAIAVVQHNTKLPTTVTVNDGTLAGKNTIAVVDAQGNNLEDVTVKAKDELVAENTVIPEGFIWLSDGQGMSTLVAKAALDFVLKDSETYPSALEGFGNGNVDVPASKVTYQRTFSATQKGNKQAWYLPVDYTITGEEDAVFYKIDFIAAAKESTEVEDITKVYIFITKMKAGDKLHANRPYVIKPNSAGNYEFVSENVTLYKRLEEPDSRLHLEKSTINYDFYGTYEPFTEAEEYQWLAMNRGLITWNGNNARLGSYRWYIKPSSKLNEDYDYTKIRIDIAGDEDVVGISTQVVDDSEIEGYYSLNGTKLAIPVQGTNIVKYKNGMTKKIFIK